MPIHYAPSRRSQAPLARGRPTSYERIAATSFRFTAWPKNLWENVVFFLSAIHLYACSFLNTTSNTLISAETSKIRSCFPMDIGVLVPFAPPHIAVCFKNGYRLTPRQNELMLKYAGTSTRIQKGKSSYAVYLCDDVSPSDFDDFIYMAPHTDHRYSGSAGYITPKSIGAYLDIRNVTLLAYSCFATAINETDAFFTGIIGPLRKSHSVTHSTIEMVSSDTPGTMAVERKDRYISDDSHMSLDISCGESNAKRLGWGESASHMISGLAAPFDTDISMPDAGGFMCMVKEFPRLFDRGSIDSSAPSLPEYIFDLDRIWKAEIMNTAQGEWLSHMFQSLVMASKMQCHLFSVFSAGRYRGSVFGGGSWVILADGKVFVPLAGEEFQVDVGILDGHVRTLDKVLDILGLEVVTKPKTMRELRALVNPERVSAMDQNKVSELLPELDFGTRVSPVNYNTLIDTFRLLTFDDPQVDMSEYMAPEAFWATDKYTRVLSRFGRRVPTFSSGSTLRKMTSVAMGEGSVKAPDYRASPPDVLQVVNQPLVSAAPVWRGLMTTGLVKGEWEKEVRGAISIRGQGKGALWAAANTHIKEVIQKEHAGNRPQGKRQAEEDEEGTGLSYASGKRVKGSSDLF
jgi:hypothetical protein